MLLPLPGGVDTLLVLLVALVVEAVVGDLRPVAKVLPGPLPLLARLAGMLDKRLNRIDRTDGARRLRGALVLVALVAGSALFGLAVTIFAHGARLGVALEIAVLASCLTVRRPWVAVTETFGALVKEGAEAGRLAVARITDRQAWSLDLHGVVRVAAESAALLLYRGVVAPAFWYALLGLPGALAWTAVSVAELVIGPDTGRYKEFGRAARLVSRLMGWLPARLSALFIALAALFVPHAKAGPALRAAAREAGGHPLGNPAWPVAALAGALELALAGPRREGELVVREPWLNADGRARAVPKDLRPALALYSVTIVITAGLTLAAGLLVMRLGW